MACFDPYREWLGIPAEQQPPNFYQILGLKPLETDIDLIRRTVTGQTHRVRYHCSGEHKDAAQRLLQEITAAGEVLLSPQRKATYDQVFSGQQPKRQPILKRAKLLTSGPAQEPGPIQCHVPSRVRVRSGSRAARKAQSRNQLRVLRWSAAGALLTAALVTGTWIAMNDPKATLPDAILVVNWPVAEREGGRLVIDGEAVPLPGTAQLSLTRRPGNHTLSATRPGHEPWRLTIELQGGEQRTVNVTLPMIADASRRPSMAAPHTVAALPDTPVLATQSEPAATVVGVPSPAVIATPSDHASNPAAKKTSPRLAALARKRAAIDAAALRVGGSWSGYRPSSAVAQVFAQGHKVPVRVFGLSGRSPFADLKSGKVDVLVVSPLSVAAIDEAIHETFAPSDPQPTRYLFGQFAVQVIVHPTNPITKLTFAQLEKVFSGEAKQWSSVGETIRPVELAGEMKTTKAFEIVRCRVMDGAGLTRQLTTFQDSAGVAAFVARRPGAIGFCMLTDKPLEHVKAVRISASAKGPYFRPNKQNVVSGEYPLREELLLFTRPGGPPLANAYCTFAQGPKGAKAARTSLLIPAQDQEEFEGQERLAERKAHGADAIVAVGNRSVAQNVADLATQFTKSEQPVKIAFSSATTTDAVSKLLAGEAEMIVLDDPLMAEVIEKEKKGWSELNPTGAVLGRRAVGVLIHAGTRTREFTLADVKDIWTGKIKSWPDTHKAIRIYAQKPDHPGALFLAQLCGGKPKVGVAWRGSTERVVQAVEKLDGAIGFVDLGELGNHPGVPLAAVLSGSEKAVAPAAGQISNDYPLAWPVMVYVSPKSSDIAKQLGAFLQPRRVAENSSRWHLFPPKM